MPPSKRDELVEAAMRVFYRNGFHTTNIDRVLHEAGISRMTLYNHFKSKDDLMIAALHRREEVFRNNLLKFVESRTDKPRERLLAVFDFHEQWFGEEEFRGCMFINAAASFSDRDSGIRRLAAQTKRSIRDYLRDQCEQAGLTEPGELAEQLNILLEGAIVTAQVVGQLADNGRGRTEAARFAKRAAQRLIDYASA